MPGSITSERRPCCPFGPTFSAVSGSFGTRRESTTRPATSSVLANAFGGIALVGQSTSFTCSGPSLVPNGTSVAVTTTGCTATLFVPALATVFTTTRLCTAR